MNLLEAEYQKQSDWNIAKTKELSTRLNLSRVKIYKWHYDRKRKEVQDMAQTTPNDSNWFEFRVAHSTWFSLQVNPNVNFKVFYNDS